MVRHEQNQMPALKAVSNFAGRMDSDSIYNYTGKILSIKKRLENDATGNGKVASEFLDALGDYGLSRGRSRAVHQYGNQNPMGNSSNGRSRGFDQLTGILDKV